jgi:glycosyltransferase involved in cell wall biosynthesis
MIVTPYFYPKVGGLENYVLNIALGLQENYGHEIVVVTSGEKTGKIKKHTIKGMSVYRLPYQIKISNTPLSLLWRRQIKAIIKQEKPDLINAHTPVPGLADIGINAAGRIPTVLTIHAATLRKEGAVAFNVVARVYELVQRKMLHDASYIITESEYVKICLPKKYQIKAKVIYNAIDPKTIPGESVLRQTDQLIFIGNLERTHAWKGLGEILLAVKILKTTNLKIELIILGEGDMRQEYEQKVKQLKIEKNVRFLGQVTGDTKYQAIKRASLIIVYPTTKNDAFPTVFLEAWACGTPIIAANIGALSSVIKNRINGQLVEPSRPDLLAKSIQKLLSEKNMLLRFAANGRSDVEKKFNWQASIKSTDQIFKSYLGPKIVHVTPLYPPKLGGTEKVVQNLARAQSKKNLNVSVITSTRGLKDRNIENLDPFLVARLRSFEIANTPVIPNLLIKLLKLDRRSILHLHIAQPYTPEMVWLASKIKNFNYIAQIHLDVPPSGPAGFLLKVYKPLILKRVLHSAKFIVVFTEDQKMSVHRKYGLELSKIKIITNGVEEDFYYGRKRSLGKRPKLLFVGRLSIQKNLTQLFYALEGVSDQFEVSIVGDGKLRSKLKETVKKLRLKNVNFVGRADDDKLLNFYKQAHIFVLTSEREGMPLVLLEAMAMSLPIIATDVVGNRDVVKEGKNGMLVPLNNIEALRATLLKLHSNKELYEEMSKMSSIMARQYSWNKISDDFENIYGEIHDSIS